MNLQFFFLCRFLMILKQDFGFVHNFIANTSFFLFCFYSFSQFTTKNWFSLRRSHTLVVKLLLLLFSFPKSQPINWLNEQIGDNNNKKIPLNFVTQDEFILQRSHNADFVQCVYAAPVTHPFVSFSIILASFIPSHTYFCFPFVFICSEFTVNLQS